MRVFNRCMIYSMGILGLVVMSSPCGAQDDNIQLEEVRPPVIGTIVVPEEEQAQSDDNPFGPSSGESGSTGELISESTRNTQSLGSGNSRKTIEEALQEMTSVEMIEMQLRDIVDYFSELHEIPILMDKKELDNEGISPELELTLMLSNVRFEDALTLLLETADLGFIVKNNVLIVVPKFIADEYYETRVYDVRGLYIDDPEALADVLIHTTGDETWREQGGSGDLSFIHSSFVVRQNRATHHEIRQLLAELRRNLEGNDELPGWPRKERKEDEIPSPGGGLGGGFGGGGASPGGGGGGGFF